MQLWDVASHRQAGHPILHKGDLTPSAGTSFAVVNVFGFPCGISRVRLSSGSTSHLGHHPSKRAEPLMMPPHSVLAQLILEVLQAPPAEDAE
jgi:hypothetical protein